MARQAAATALSCVIAGALAVTEVPRKVTRHCIVSTLMDVASMLRRISLSASACRTRARLSVSTYARINTCTHTPESKSSAVSVICANMVIFRASQHLPLWDGPVSSCHGQTGLLEANGGAIIAQSPKQLHNHTSVLRTSAWALATYRG